MNTNAIKKFAVEARRSLMEGVMTSLNHWGFDESAQVHAQPKPTHGGYIFRGQVFSDENDYTKWQKLHNRIKTPEDFINTTEEAAYTWFNRLMAIQILEKNNYISPVLPFSEGTRTPAIVQNARRGMHKLHNTAMQDSLDEYLRDDKDTEAFNLLINDFCNHSSLLYNVFGGMDDYTELLIPSNLLMENGFLDKLNTSRAISDEDYRQVELIGWMYQFYISEKKDEVFKGFKQKKKARPEDIPAATEIFTPRWIVSYMVENTLGKLYLAMEPGSPLKDKMNYLVENPADETEDSIVDDVTGLTLLDPACGSGHILVVAFEWLMEMYREQGYNARQAVKSILQHNLYGLDIDLRAMQLARFALLLKAAEYDADVLKTRFYGGPDSIRPHVYTFPENLSLSSESIDSFLGKEGYQYTKELAEQMHLLQQGKNIGSALKLSLSDEAIKHIKKRFREKAKASDMDTEFLRPFLEPLLLLTQQYTAVVANPPYMGQKNMNGELKNYINDNYPKSKSDLFAVFMEVALNLAYKQGLMGMINQHSWMFLSSYEKLRETILQEHTIKSMLHLGPRTFEELSGEVVQSTAFVLENESREEAKANYHRLVEYKSNHEKEKAFLNGKNYFPNVSQTNFAKIPGSPIAYWVSEKVTKAFENKKLSDYATLFQGMITGNNDNKVKYWQEIDYDKLNTKEKNIEEINVLKKYWIPYNKGGKGRKWYGNHDLVVNFRHKGCDFTRNRTKFIDYYFNESVSWSYISSSSLSSRYYPKGFLWDVAGSSMFCESIKLKSICSLLNSFTGGLLLGIINPTLNYQVENVGNVPYMCNNSDEVIIEIFFDENVKISRLDWDSNEYSWDFQQMPLIQYNTSLESAFRQWHEKAKADFLQLHQNEEELNRIFIDIYGLQDELTPDVPFKEITILQDEVDTKQLEEAENEYRETGELQALPIKQDVVMMQLLSYALGCMLGRYSLDKPGLIMANQGEQMQEALEKHGITNQQFPMDDDGIISLNGNDSPFPDDAAKRVKEFLKVVWGENTLTENINFLNNALGMPYEKWLKEKFWQYHCRLYKKTPIYWLFASNPKRPQASAFKVLAYMHRMNKYSLQNIRSKYLHPYMQWMRDEIKTLKADEDNLSGQELKRLNKLQENEQECIQYDDTLKRLGQIEFDLDDGVKENIKKFKGAVAEIK